MSTAKKRSSFQITSVTSDSSQTPPGQSASGTILNLLQSEASSSGRHGSSSQPSTPCLNKKTAHDAPGQGTGSSSRFRVVRLAVGGASSKGRGESYHRGRWTSTDFMERPEGAGIRRVMESTRHAHSLESLEMIGRDNERGWVHSQDTSHLLAQPIRDPPSPTHPENSLLVDQRQPKEKQTLDSASPRPLARPNRKPPPLRLDFDADGRSVLRLSHSQPSSPPVGLHQPPPANVQTLDQSIFNPGNDSFSTNSLIAIDNKIEQAMDLVKSHLLLAVREEVELLREQIRDLQQKNQQLERENHVLRALNTTHCDEP